MSRLFQDYKTVADVAAEIGVHVRTVDRWLRQGVIYGCTLDKTKIVDVKKSRAAIAARASARVHGRRATIK